MQTTEKCVRRWLIGLILILNALHTAFAVGQTTQPSKLVEAYTPSLGGDSARLGLQPALIRDGWQPWVDANVTPEIYWAKSGGKPIRFIIHMPFGRDQNGGTFLLSEFLRCKTLAPRVANKSEFVAAWMPITDSGTEVIAYLGEWQNDPLFVSLWKTDRAAWMAKLAECFDLPLAAGMSIAIDASSDMKDDSPGAAVLRLIEAMGAKTYTETATAHVTRARFIAIDTFYEAHIRGKDDPTGSPELLIWCQIGNPWTRGYFDTVVRKYQAEGKTVIVPAGWLRQGLPGRGDYQ